MLPFESWFFSVNLTFYGAKLLNNFTSKFDCIRKWPGTRAMTEARSYKNIITEIFDFIWFIILAIFIPLLHQIERLPCFQKVERIARMINRLNLFWYRKENISRKCNISANVFSYEWNEVPVASDTSLLITLCKLYGSLIFSYIILVTKQLISKMDDDKRMNVSYFILLKSIQQNKWTF